MKIIKEKSFGVIPFRKINGDVEFFLINHIAGYWGFPKGHSESGESEIETARRELKEETGITNVNLSKNISFIDNYCFENGNNTINKTVEYFLGFTENENSIIIDNNEVLDYSWVIYEEALKLINFDGLKSILNQAHDRIFKNKIRIILGSASVGRRKILKNMGYDFEIMPADIDEKAIRSDDPKELTLMLARAKADALLSKIKEPALLITSDQVGVCNERIIEKPKDAGEAREYLRAYAKYPAKTVTEVVVTNTETNRRVEGIDVAEVEFFLIPEEAIEAAIKKGDIFTQSGGFSIDDPILGKYVKEVCGERESVIGLPKKLTRKLLNKMIKKW